MSSTTETIKHLSKDLGINEDALIREGIIEYLKSRIRTCMRDKIEIMSRYKISSLEDFEKKIQEGIIPEHPGWEDLIVLENLENSINKLSQKLSYVENVSKS